jgi:hypothetical protein
LPITTVEVIEGGQKGQKVAVATKLAVDKFFSFGVAKIQNECNNVARRYCALWNAKSSELMSEYHFQITYSSKALSFDFIVFVIEFIAVRFGKYF